MNYQSIKDLAAEQGARVSDFLALSEDNDPFYSGRPSSKAEAEWFLGIWKEFGFSQGVHVRRIHYRIVTSKQEVSFRDGTRYLNTEKCWNPPAIARRCVLTRGNARNDTPTGQRIFTKATFCALRAGQRR